MFRRRGEVKLVKLGECRKIRLFVLYVSVVMLFNPILYDFVNGGGGGVLILHIRARETVRTERPHIQFHAIMFACSSISKSDSLIWTAVMK